MQGKNRVFFLRTFGAGTPKYLIVASSRAEAFKIAQEQWKLDGYALEIGQSWNFNTGKNTKGNTESDVKDTGLYTDKPEGTILNLSDL